MGEQKNKRSAAKLQLQCTHMQPHINAIAIMKNSTAANVEHVEPQKLLFNVVHTLLEFVNYIKR